MHVMYNPMKHRKCAISDTVMVVSSDNTVYLLHVLSVMCTGVRMHLCACTCIMYVHSLEVPKQQTCTK